MLVTCSNKGMEYELSEYFTFKVPGFRFMPAFKRGSWDGKIRLFNTRLNILYKGLITHVEKWAAKNNYKVDIDESWKDTEFTTKQALEFISSLNLPKEITPRNYQIESFVEAIRKKRLTILSPTGSGKSLIIYLIIRYLNLKTLIIVPKVTLVHQLAEDIKSYGYKEEIHKIFSGEDKQTDKLYSITTWQSIFRLKKEFFDQYHVVIVDETHQAKSASIKSCLEKCINIIYRYGTTGTLDGENANKWVIEGLLGPVHKVTSSSELIENKILAKFNIKILVLKYTEAITDMVKGLPYQKELAFIVGYEKRNDLIVNLVTKIPGNNLVLFRFIEKHGDILLKKFQEKTDRPIYYIHGGIDAKIREKMRADIENEKNAIILGSIQAIGVGTNIIKLNNIFFTSPSKSRITNLQAIGRVLRKSKIKTTATLYDIADDLSVKTKRNKSHFNYTMRHFLERLKIYKSENFPFKIFNIKVK